MLLPQKSRRLLYGPCPMQERERRKPEAVWGMGQGRERYGEGVGGWRYGCANCPVENKF